MILKMHDPTSWSLVWQLVQRMHSHPLVRNSLYLMSTTVVTSGLGYVYWLVAARSYSAHDVGLAAALISATTLASGLCSLGLGPALVQALPHCTPGRAWSLALTAALTMGLLGSMLAGVLMVLLLPLLSHQFAAVGHNALYTLTLMAGIPLWTAGLVLDAAFVAERAAGKVLVRNMTVAMLKIPLLLVPLLAQGQSLGIFSAWVLATAVASLGALLVLVPRLGRGYRLTVRGLGGQLRSMLSFFAGNHIIELGGMAPMYLLPLWVVTRLSADDNAYFYITWMVGLLFFMVSSSVSTSLFVEGSHTAENIRQKVRTSLIIIAALLFPAMIIFLLGGHAILAVFGPSYPRHGLVLLELLIISSIPDAITNVYTSVLRVQHRLPQAGLLSISMASLTLVLAWILLPPLGIAGAGWAWLAGQSAGSLLVGAQLLRVSYAGRRVSRRVRGIRAEKVLL